MEMLGKVRRLYSRDKKSLHEIAKTTGLSRNTIRKWVRDTGDVAKPTYRRSEMPCKLTAFAEALDLALKADAHRTKQNRRTGKALFVQIKAAGYTGGYPTLCKHAYAMESRTGDQHDAYVVATWLREADQDGRLRAALGPNLSPGDRLVAKVEGWILGVG